LLVQVNPDIAWVNLLRGRIGCHMRRCRKFSAPCLWRFYGLSLRLLMQYPG
jgi:hypothetical protein